MEPPPQPQQPPPSQLLFTPLMISLAGIVSTALAISLYHIIVNKFCLRRQTSIGASSQRTEDLEQQNGVESKVLNLIPIISYSTKQGDLFGVDEIECAVCLSEIEEGEIVRLLPSCKHAFHVECIDEWFFSHSNCPVCRSPIVASMISLVQVDLENGINSVGDDVGHGNINGSGRRVGSKRLLRHCVSVILPTEEENSTSSLPIVLKRSFSMDNAIVSRKMNEQDSSSSSSKDGLLPSKSSIIDSLIKSYNRLRLNQSTTGEEALPR